METDLDRLFDALNRELFQGTLPKYRVRRRPAEHGERGLIDEAERTIWICQREESRATLLHEMCHIGTPGHGRLFRAKLRRLAAQGEVWAQRERAYYLRLERGIPVGGWSIFWELVHDVR